MKTCTQHLLIAWITAGLTLSAAKTVALTSEIELGPDGVVKVAGMSFQPFLFGNGYAQNNLAASHADLRREKESVLAQTFFADGRMTVALTAESNGSYDYSTEVRFAKPTQVLGVMIKTIVPETCRISIPGKNTSFPAYNPQKVDLLWSSGKMLAIELTDGRTLEITGNIVTKIIDRRGKGGPGFELRLYFSPHQGELTESRLHLNFALKSPNHTTVNLTKVVNTGFRDDKAGDGTGGWTDQGPNNDLRILKSRVVRVGYVEFNVIDQDKNNGRSVIAIGGKRQVREVTVDTTARGNYLGLIHATAWTQPGKAGEIEVRYRNGATQTIEINSGRDVDNWWEPLNRKNGYVAWTGDTNQNRVGLFFSQFRLDRDDPIRITLRGNDSQLWLIPALSIFEKKVNTDNLVKEYVTAPGNEWVALESIRDVVPGSPLDFSDQLDAPAGKYGRVIANHDGNLVFEKKKDVAIRFVGTNLCFSAQYLSKPEADELADCLIRIGYNAVRIHHHDNALIDRNAPDSLTFDKVNLDKLDYLIYAFKKRGIYIATDIYVSRVIKAGDAIPEFVPGADGQVKLLLPISAQMRENWKMFAKKWLTHRNPYTGMSLLDDPVLYSISLTNENNINRWWSRYPELASRYLERFQTWQKKQFPDKEVVTFKQDKRLFERFLYELQEKYTLELYHYLKDELQVKALLSDLNMQKDIPLALIRDRMDAVDNHKYHDHPKFPGQRFKFPYSFRQHSAIQGLGNEVPGYLLPTRIFGKPFSVTEYRYCHPNQFRVEGGPLIGAYAALQDWDALYQFAWAHSRSTVVADGPMASLNCANDQLSQLSDRLVMLLFRRQDVAVAKDGVALRVPTDFWQSADPIDSPEKFGQLGLITRVGVVVGNKTVPGVELISRTQAEGFQPLREKEIENRRQEMFKSGIARSTTGELVLDSKAVVFKVDTLYSKVLTAIKGSHQVGALQVFGIETPTTVAACALDDRELASSSKILFFHLTDVCDSGIKFQGAERKIMLSAGKLPHLLRRAKIKITLVLNGNDPVSVYALKSNGDRYGKINVSRTPGQVEFESDNGKFSGGVMAYLLEKTINK